MDNRQSKLIIAACFIISAMSVGYVLWGRAQKNPVQTNFPPPFAAATEPSGNVVTSPDGKWTLTSKETKHKDSTSYSFKAMNTKDGTQKEIYTAELSTGETLTIPLNTFSPDDKYVFLMQTATSGSAYFALTVSGDPIAKDAQTIDFSSLFAAKYSNYKITDATGWGGMNLIVFNTDKATGGQGPSFWFDVPSHSIIQLSNRFN